MTFTVIPNDNTKYTISFLADGEEATFCNIFDNNLNFVISAGHSILSPDDDYSAIEGMKHALRRALDAPPCLFDRKTRGMIWESFWASVDTFMLTADSTDIEWF